MADKTPTPDRYACLHCLRRHSEPGLCPACERDELLDLFLPVDRELWGSRRRQQQVRRWTLAYTGVAFLFAFGGMVALLSSLEPVFSSMLGAPAAVMVLNAAAILLAAVFVVPVSWIAARGQPAQLPPPVDHLLPAVEEADPAAARPARPAAPEVSRGGGWPTA